MGVTYVARVRLRNFVIVVVALLGMFQASGLAQDTPAPSTSSSAPSNSTPPDNPQQNQNPDATKQDSSDEKKNDSPNPAQAAADKTKDLTIEAAEATKKLGQETFVHARDWEYKFITGPYIPRNAPMVPLTARDRERIYLQSTLTTPGPYLKRMFVAGVDQLRDSPQQWGEGWGSYAERFASREGQFLTSNTVAAISNAALRYEPRYDECRCSGFKLRTRHAILRNFLTYNQSEQEMRPQLGLYAGAFVGGALSSTWKPGPRTALKDAGWAMLGQAGYGALLNFVTEFSRDINRKLGARRRQ